MRRFFVLGRAESYALMVVVLAGLGLTAPLWAAERVKPVTGSYKQAMRKAGEAGKLLMIDFYTDWCGYCKKMNKQVDEISETVNKFAYYRVNAEQDRKLTQEFGVHGYPTVVFVKPDGTELHRWSGAYPTTDQFKRALEAVLEKAGPIKPQESPDAKKSAATNPAAKSAAETAAANELKTAQTYLNVGRKNDAVRALKQIIAKYPGTEAAATAKEKLDELDGDGK